MKRTLMFCAIFFVGLLTSCSGKLTMDQIRAKAEKGDVNCQYLLGDSLLLGHECEKNSDEGIKWLLKAADQGHAKAQFVLGGCYLLGDGVKQDHDEAVKWLRKAAEQGNPGAQEMLQNMEHE